VSGTWGAGIDDTLLGTIIGWTHGTNKHYQIVRKGWYPYTEHFGAFAAEVAYPMVESTLFNAPLARELNNYTQILIAGEAKSHCVNNTIKQMIAKAPELVAKLYILEDAMSPVTGFEQLSDETFAKACELGARITDTTTFWAN
jgi:nicotinamidase-related amidase